MEYLIILMSPLISIIYGYLIGKDQVNPFTPEGIEYYKDMEQM